MHLYLPTYDYNTDVCVYVRFLLRTRNILTRMYIHTHFKFNISLAITIIEDLQIFGRSPIHSRLAANSCSMPTNRKPSNRGLRSGKNMLFMCIRRRYHHLVLVTREEPKKNRNVIRAFPKAVF